MSRHTESRKRTPTKKRSQSCYNTVVEKITKWYNHLEKERTKPVAVNPNTKQEVKRKELKPLSWYIGQIRKVQ